MPNVSALGQALQNFEAWRQSLVAALRAIAGLSNELGYLSGGTLLRMENLAFEIEQESLRLAVVGEFSRGKSELINALLFAHMGRRFLPSSSGQTTMCPVEIRGAPLGRPGLRLLPIASRGMDVNIDHLKRVGSAWERRPLMADGGEADTASLRALTETLCVSTTEARRLGLCPSLGRNPHELLRTTCPSCGDGRVLIPRWRHAQLYCPHPLLDAGLTVLDTPGLNAIGAEPELTFGMLADADAVLFLLGVDTGVTQSDLMIWEQYLRRNVQQKHLVLLNKIDTLWDELRAPEAVDAEIAEQCDKTAERLRIEADRVIPISGQKALVARVRQDAPLLQRSGILILEEAIGRLVIPARQQALQGKCEHLVARGLADQRLIIRVEEDRLQLQVQEMVDLKDRSSEKLPHLLKRYRQRLEDFDADRRGFEQRKSTFQAAVQRELLDPLSPDTFDLVIANAKGEMLSAWTTARIVDRFQDFFSQTIRRFDLALEGAERVNAQILREYAELQHEHRLPPLQAVPYAMLPRRAELLAMAENYERFGSMLEIAVNTQSTVVRKAFLTVAGKVRDFVIETRRDAELWVDEVMGVLNAHLDAYHLRGLEELRALERLSETVESIDGRIAELREQIQILQDRRQRLDQAERGIAALLGATAAPSTAET